MDLYTITLNLFIYKQMDELKEIQGKLTQSITPLIILVIINIVSLFLYFLLKFVVYIQ